LNQCTSNRVKESEKQTGKNRFVFFRFLFIAVMLIAFVQLALFDGLIVKEYNITTSMVEGQHKYVVITDLHATLYGEGQKELLKKISKADPEAVFLIGDIAEEDRDFLNVALLLEKITDVYPCYYVAGNHERWLDYTENIGELISSYGVTVLDGDGIVLNDGIRLCGVFDPLFYDSSEAFANTVAALDSDGEYFDILLSHRPEYASEYVESGMELTLCGHAHGGQMRIPLILNGLYAPNQGFFPKYAGGIYRFDGGDVIVSRGMMKDDLPRVFNPPELVVVNICGTERSN